MTRIPVVFSGLSKGDEKGKRFVLRLLVLVTLSPRDRWESLFQARKKESTQLASAFSGNEWSAKQLEVLA